MSDGERYDMVLNVRAETGGMVHELYHPSFGSPIRVLTVKLSLYETTSSETRAALDSIVARIAGESLAAFTSSELAAYSISKRDADSD